MFYFRWLSALFFCLLPEAGRASRCETIATIHKLAAAHGVRKIDHPASCVTHVVPVLEFMRDQGIDLRTVRVVFMFHKSRHENDIILFAGKKAEYHQFHVAIEHERRLIDLHAWHSPVMLPADYLKQQLSPRNVFEKLLYGTQLDEILVQTTSAAEYLSRPTTFSKREGGDIVSVTQYDIRPFNHLSEEGAISAKLYFESLEALPY